MVKLEMKKTVYDGKVYHKVNEIVEVTDEKAKMYIERGYAVASQEVKPAIVETKEEIPAETKEQKVVYKTKKKK